MSLWRMKSLNSVKEESEESPEIQWDPDNFNSFVLVWAEGSEGLQNRRVKSVSKIQRQKHTLAKINEDSDSSSTSSQNISPQNKMKSSKYLHTDVKQILNSPQWFDMSFWPESSIKYMTNRK